MSGNIAVDPIKVHHVVHYARFHKRTEGITWKQAIIRSIAEDPTIAEEQVLLYFSEASEILLSEARRSAERLPRPFHKRRSRHSRRTKVEKLEITEIMRWWQEFMRSPERRAWESFNMQRQRGHDPKD